MIFSFADHLPDIGKMVLLSGLKLRKRGAHPVGNVEQVAVLRPACLLTQIGLNIAQRIKSL